MADESSLFGDIGAIAEARGAQAAAHDDGVHGDAAAAAATTAGAGGDGGAKVHDDDDEGSDDDAIEQGEPEAFVMNQVRCVTRLNARVVRRSLRVVQRGGCRVRRPTSSDTVVV
jgi:hypothetical protein